MKHCFLFFAFLGFLLFTACTKPCPPLTDVQKKEIEKQVLDQWNNLGKSVEISDADGYMAFFSSEGFVSMYSQGLAFKTRTEYADTVKVWFGKRKSNQIDPKSVYVTVLSADLALLDQSAVFQASFNDGTVLRIDHVASFLFRKEANSWKIIQGHESWKSDR